MAFQILTLSGGGFLGLYTATILAELENRVGCPIANCFDLLAGTSVGGIIALGLAAEKPAIAIKQAFEKKGTAIFSNRRAPLSKIAQWCDLTRSLWAPKYEAHALQETIAEIVGQDTMIGDLKHCVLIPAVNLTTGSPQVFKTPHHPTFQRDLHLRVVDVGLATSAAPTYFPIAAVNDELFADGGLYANSPDLLALHEAEYFLQVQTVDVRMLSIGTTTSRFSFSHSTGRRLGVLGWVRNRRLAQTIISLQQLNTDDMLRHKLGDRYLRIDEVQSKEQERDLGLDVATEDAQRTTRAMAEGSIRAVINNPRLDIILAHRAPEPRFHHRHEGVSTRKGKS